MTAQRQPAIRKTHPAEELPERPARIEPSPSTPAPTPAPARSITPSVTGSDPDPAEGLSTTHNTRIRPSIKARLRRGVDKLRYETGDRTISEASITDRALQEYLDRQGL